LKGIEKKAGRHFFKGIEKKKDDILCFVKIPRHLLTRDFVKKRLNFILIDS